MEILATRQCRKRCSFLFYLHKCNSNESYLQTKHSSQMASLIGKMLGQKTEALTNTSDLTLTEKLANICLQYQMLVVIFLLSYLHVQWSKVGKSTESAENLFKCKIFSETSSCFERSWKWEDSNFTQLYIPRKEDNERLSAWRTEKKINKYVHSTIQMRWCK